MNDERPPFGRTRGSALLLALVFTFVLLVLVLGLMQIVALGTRNTENLVHRRQALLLAQAGIAEALQEINARRDLSGDGQVGGVVLEQWGLRESFTVTCTEDAQGGSYTLISTGTVDLSGGTSADPLLRVSRTLQTLVARCQGPSAMFPGGLFSNGDLQVFGNATIDSWDHTTKTIGQTNGNVGSNGNVTVGGGSSIQGNATPGPKGTVRVAGSGTTITGSTAPRTYPIRSYKPPYNPPAAAGSLPFDPGGLNGDVNVTSGTYRISEWNQTGGTVTFKAPGHTAIYIDGDYSQVGGSAAVESGASVTFYSQSGNIVIRGGGAAGADGSPGNPNDYQFIACATSGSTVKLSGDSSFCGTIYAPMANVSIGGKSEVYGAILGGTILCTSGGSVHCDLGTYMPFDPNADAELKYCREILP